MTFASTNGAQFICRVLESRNVQHVFGLPGSQNAILFSELRRSTIDPVVTTNEMSAGFAALGYAVAAQRPAVMAVIGGPGFTYAITPLQEAKLDSVPLVCIVFVRSGDISKSFRLQQMDYHSVAASICKSVSTVSTLDEFPSAFDDAMALADAGEPGPVLVVVESTLLDQPNTQSLTSFPAPTTPSPPALPSNQLDRLKQLLHGQRILLYLGRGASGSSQVVTELAEQLDAAVLTTTSGRGVIDERHPRVLSSDLVPVATVNEFIKGFDRVLAMGVRFSENGSRGYGLRFGEQQLIHIDASVDVLDANYTADFSMQADVRIALNALLDSSIQVTCLKSTDLERWRKKFSEARDTSAEPQFQGLATPTATQFFSELQKLLPNDSVLVTDSGSHQMLSRKHWLVRSANGLLVPTNFQSMGFAIPAAIGVACARPERRVAVILGDGGLQMSGLQLLAAVEKGLRMTVFVFNDGYFGHIRSQQLQYDGQEAGTVLPPLDLSAFCDAIGAAYFDGSSDLISAMTNALGCDRVSVVEVLLNDAKLVHRMRTKATVKRFVKNSLLGTVLRWIGG